MGSVPKASGGEPMGMTTGEPETGVDDVDATGERPVTRTSGCRAGTALLPVPLACAAAVRLFTKLMNADSELRRGRLSVGGASADAEAACAGAAATAAAGLRLRGARAADDGVAGGIVAAAPPAKAGGGPSGVTRPGITACRMPIRRRTSPCSMDGWLLSARCRSRTRENSEGGSAGGGVFDRWAAAVRTKFARSSGAAAATLCQGVRGDRRCLPLQKRRASTYYDDDDGDDEDDDVQ